MKIIYTQQAVNDLKRLRDFIKQGNPHAAQEISKRLIQAINRLVDFPLLGRKAKENNNNPISIRDLITGKYVIRYLTLENEVHILRIWHGKEDRF
jgi:addiction module RelE/StbE family toxin